MSMNFSDIPELDTKGLRNFGFTTGSIVAGLFGLLLPWLFGFDFPKWPWIFAGVLVLWAAVLPATLRPVYHGWMRFGLLLGKITTPIILILVYAIAVVPMSLLLRLLRKDLLQRKFDSSSSYRVESKEPSVSNMEKPY